MAIDTADKRFSALGYPGGWFYVAPTPTGAFDSNEDRVQLLGLYRLAADLPIVIVPDVYFPLMRQPNETDLLRQPKTTDLLGN